MYMLPLYSSVLCMHIQWYKLSFNNTVERKRTEVACARNQVFLHGCLQAVKLYQLQSGKQCATEWSFCAYTCTAVMMPATTSRMGTFALTYTEYIHLQSRTTVAYRSQRNVQTARNRLSRRSVTVDHLFASLFSQKLQMYNVSGFHSNYHCIHAVKCILCIHLYYNYRNFVNALKS